MYSLNCRELMEAGGEWERGEDFLQKKPRGLVLRASWPSVDVVLY